MIYSRFEATRSVYDVVIVGAGLAGLTAALSLQRSGARVAIVEKGRRCGGLCGTFIQDGYEFVIACNDFGAGLARRLRELDVPFHFERKKTWVFHQGRRIELPASPGTLLKGLPLIGQLLPALTKMLFPALRSSADQTLGGLVDSCVREAALNDLLKLPAYQMGVRPGEFATDFVAYDFRFGYGYRDPITPVGGPQALVDALVARVQQGDGDIFLNARFLGVARSAGEKRVLTDCGELTCQQVINAGASPRFASQRHKEGLPLSMFLVALDANLPYPPDVHTIIHYPPDPEIWFGALDQGRMSNEFGFHLFCSDLSSRTPGRPKNGLAPTGGGSAPRAEPGAQLTRQSDHYTVNVYFYLPRGVDEPDGDTVARCRDYIFRNIETALPGFNGAIKYAHFLSPQAFCRVHGLSSRVMPRILPVEVQKPYGYDTAADIYYAGNSVYPPGDHAGASVMSGLTAASRVSRRLAGS